MVRAPCCEKMGLKRGPWSLEEDEILTSYIQKHGHGNWRALPKLAGTCNPSIYILRKIFQVTFSTNIWEISHIYFQSIFYISVLEFKCE